MRHITATVITATEQRVRLSLIAHSRTAAELVISTLYPDHLYCSCIVRRS